MTMKASEVFLSRLAARRPEAWNAQIRVALLRCLVWGLSGLRPPCAGRLAVDLAHFRFGRGGPTGVIVRGPEGLADAAGPAPQRLGMADGSPSAVPRSPSARGAGQGRPPPAGGAAPPGRPLVIAPPEQRSSGPTVERRSPGQQPRRCRHPGAPADVRGAGPLGPDGPGRPAQHRHAVEHRRRRQDLHLLAVQGHPLVRRRRFAADDIVFWFEEHA